MDVDLYDDLLISDEPSEREKALADENESLKKLNSELEARVKTLLESNETIQKKVQALENNISSLIKTARTEINRKNETIASLKREMDSIILRRSIKTGSREDYEQVFAVYSEALSNCGNFNQVLPIPNESSALVNPKPREEPKNDTKAGLKSKEAVKSSSERSRLTKEDRRSAKLESRSDPIRSSTRDTSSRRKQSEARSVVGSSKSESQTPAEGPVESKKGDSVDGSKSSGVAGHSRVEAVARTDTSMAPVTEEKNIDLKRRPDVAANGQKSAASKPEAKETGLKRKRNDDELPPPKKPSALRVSNKVTDLTEETNQAVETEKIPAVGQPVPDSPAKSTRSQSRLTENKLSSKPSEAKRSLIDSKPEIAEKVGDRPGKETTAAVVTKEADPVNKKSKESIGKSSSKTESEKAKPQELVAKSSSATSEKDEKSENVKDHGGVSEESQISSRSKTEEVKKNPGEKKEKSSVSSRREKSPSREGSVASSGNGSNGNRRSSDRLRSRSRERDQLGRGDRTSRHHERDRREREREQVAPDSHSFSGQSRNETRVDRDSCYDKDRDRARDHGGRRDAASDRERGRDRDSRHDRRSSRDRSYRGGDGKIREHRRDRNDSSDRNKDRERAEHDRSGRSREVRKDDSRRDGHRHGDRHERRSGKSRHDDDDRKKISESSRHDRDKNKSSRSRETDPRKSEEKDAEKKITKRSPKLRAKGSDGDDVEDGEITDSDDDEEKTEVAAVEKISDRPVRGKAVEKFDSNLADSSNLMPIAKRSPLPEVVAKLPFNAKKTDKVHKALTTVCPEGPIHAAVLPGSGVEDANDELATAVAEQQSADAVSERHYLSMEGDHGTSEVQNLSDSGSLQPDPPADEQSGASDHADVEVEEEQQVFSDDEEEEEERGGETEPLSPRPSPASDFPADLADVDTTDLDSLIQAKMELMDYLKKKQNKYMSKILKSRKNSETELHPTIVPVPGDQHGLKIRIALPSRRSSDENDPPQSSEASQFSTPTQTFSAGPSVVDMTEQESVSHQDEQPPVVQKTSPLTVWNLCKTGNQKRLKPASDAADQTSSPLPEKAPAEPLVSPETWQGSSRCSRTKVPTTPGIAANGSSPLPRSTHDSPKNLSSSINLCSPWGEGIQDLFSDSWKSSPSPLSLQQSKTSLDFNSTAGIASILKGELITGGYISPSTGIIRTPTPTHSKSRLYTEPYSSITPRRSPRKFVLTPSTASKSKFPTSDTESPVGKPDKVTPEKKKRPKLNKKELFKSLGLEDSNSCSNPAPDFGSEVNREKSVRPNSSSIKFPAAGDRKSSAARENVDGRSDARKNGSKPQDRPRDHASSKKEVSPKTRKEATCPKSLSPPNLKPNQSSAPKSSSSSRLSLSSQILASFGLDGSHTLEPVTSRSNAEPKSDSVASKRSSDKVHRQVSKSGVSERPGKASKGSPGNCAKSGDKPIISKSPSTALLASCGLDDTPVKECSTVPVRDSNVEQKKKKLSFDERASKPEPPVSENANDQSKKKVQKAKSRLSMSTQSLVSIPTVAVVVDDENVASTKVESCDTFQKLVAPSPELDTGVSKDGDMSKQPEDTLPVLVLPAATSSTTATTTPSTMTSLTSSSSTTAPMPPSFSSIEGSAALTASAPVVKKRRCIKLSVSTSTLASFRPDSAPAEVGPKDRDSEVKTIGEKVTSPVPTKSPPKRQKSRMSTPKKKMVTSLGLDLSSSEESSDEEEGTEPTVSKDSSSASQQDPAPARLDKVLQSHLVDGSKASGNSPIDTGSKPRRKKVKLETCSKENFVHVVFDQED